MNLKRLLIDKMENRILIGLTMILASMVLIGWVAINEQGRMLSFQEEHLARSIEHGGELFSSHCAECHGPSALGSARAPALNNPQLFGVDFLAPLNDQISTLEATKTDVTALQEQLAGDTSKLDNLDALKAQMDNYISTYGDDPVAGIDSQISDLQTQKQNMVTSMNAAVQKGYDPEHPSRLDILGWAGTLDGFVLTTVLSGRPVSASYWPQPMPTWSQLGGGPLRSDELQDLTNYVINFGNKTWTVEDLLAVNQFAKVPGEVSTGAVDNAVAPDVADMQQGDIAGNRSMIDENVTRVMGDIDTLTGDPNNGQALYTGEFGCSACHTTSVAPPVDGTYTRVQNTRLADPALAGYTAEHYLVESILVPNAYIAPGYAPGTMPQNFGKRLTVQQLADIVAYLKSQDGPDPLAQ